ncbi:MAG: hypothetical protein ACOYJ6_17840 [Caulobacterales bacterium]
MNELEAACANLIAQRLMRRLSRRATNRAKRDLARLNLAKIIADAAHLKRRRRGKSRAPGVIAAAWQAKRFLSAMAASRLPGIVTLIVAIYLRARIVAEFRRNGWLQ